MAIRRTQDTHSQSLSVVEMRDPDLHQMQITSGVHARLPACPEK
jgi:hypothetical protein